MPSFPKDHPKSHNACRNPEHTEFLCCCQNMIGCYWEIIGGSSFTQPLGMSGEERKTWDTTSEEDKQKALDAFGHVRYGKLEEIKTSGEEKDMAWWNNWKRSFRGEAEVLRNELLLGVPELMEAIARGWCHPKTKHLEMNDELAYAIAEEVMPILAEERRQFLAEVREMVKDESSFWFKDKRIPRENPHDRILSRLESLDKMG